MPFLLRLWSFALVVTLVAGCVVEAPPDAPPDPDDSITPTLRASVLWQDYLAARDAVGAAERAVPPAQWAPESLQEYAAKCDAAVGLHVPTFACDSAASAEPPYQGTTPSGHSCEQPNVLNGECDPGSRFQVLASNADAAVVAHCRKVGKPVAGTEYSDIAVIQYNRQNGAVCFYQALGSLPGHSVGAPSDGTWPFWFPPSITHNIGCTSCHDNGGFLRSPYLAQLGLLPTAPTFNNLDTPLRYVGQDFASDRSWSVGAPPSTCPSGQSCDACSSCHRLAVNNVRPRGTALDLALKATAPTQASKVPHGPTSPIWMRLGQTYWSAEAEQSARNFMDCAMGFYGSGFVTAPAGCTMTPLGTAYAPPISANGQGDDLAAIGAGAATGGQLVVGFSNRDGSFAVTNTTGDYFSALARLSGVRAVAGDFNNDGRSDVALVGGIGWLTIPVAMSRGDGTFYVTNANAGPDFNNWARTAGVKVLAGDYNGDHFTDLALTGGSGWASIPVAYSRDGGDFEVKNQAVGASFGAWASAAGARPLVGDYNGDGHSDIALVGVGGWASIPVAFGREAGPAIEWFDITNQPAPSMGPWSAAAHVTPLTGDFNGDGHTDIALTGAIGWASIPVALGQAGGAWIVTNQPAGSFGALASTATVTPLAGDFNHDGRTDLALIGEPSWSQLPVALAAGYGNWTIKTEAAPGMGGWAHAPGVRAVVGDYNGDGSADIALVGGPGWASIPIAFSAGAAAFVVTNAAATFLPSVASDPAATIVVGRFN